MKIAFGYKMGTGKDTAVDHLIRKYGGTKVSFAGPIYEIMRYAQEVCGFEYEKDRKFLQWVGTEWAREKSPNIWIDIAVKTASDPDQDYYISDIRFVNELEALQRAGFMCIKLNRDVDQDRVGTGSSEHLSENSLDSVPDKDWDIVIDNNGTLEELYEKINILYCYRQIGGRSYN